MHCDLVMGVPGGMPGTAAALVAAVAALPAGATWSATGIGRTTLPVLLAALAAGGHLRVGMEDTTSFARGRPVTGNAELVERAATLAEAGPAAADAAGAGPGAAGGERPSADDHPVLAEVVRSGFAESRHRRRRSAAARRATGGRPAGRGPGRPSRCSRGRSNKPMQAAAMLRAGLRLDGKLLALAAASHSGEDFHVAGVREILAGAGLAEGALQCPPALPMDEAAQRAAPRAAAAGRTGCT